MGKGFKHGGGGAAASALNFKIVGGTAQPSGLENTIWVNTANPVNGWVLSPVQPAAPEPGMVWIAVGSASAAVFNALKKNGIMVYPTGAKQYVDGAWANKSAMIYLNGSWVSFSTEAVYLYIEGDICESLTGGYTAAAMRASSSDSGAGVPAVTYGESAMVILSDKPTSTGAYRGGIVRTVNKIDCSGYSRLIFEGTVEGAEYQYNSATIYLWTEIGEYQSDNCAGSMKMSSGSNSVELDIASLTGSYYIGFGLNGTNVQITVTMTGLRLE